MWMELRERRNRGWPWPDGDMSYLSGLYGEDGWCRSCGIPQGKQTGSLVLQSRALSPTGVWAPNLGRYICMEAPLADKARSDFSVDLRPVLFPSQLRHDPGNVEVQMFQLLIPRGDSPWFDPDELSNVLVAAHGEAGRLCEECGKWKWMPLIPDHLPAPSIPSREVAAIASQEWFGDGQMAFQLDAFSPGLAQLLHEAGPRDLNAIPWQHVA